jgi:hypothetical protein
MSCGEHEFDRQTKGLRGDLSRRQALKGLGAMMAGAVLGTLGVGKAHAKGKCSPVGACGTYENCGGSDTCWCGADAKKGKALCFEDIACADAMQCRTNKDCKKALGKGWKCLAADNCCGFALCVADCGKGTRLKKKTGPTAARA